MSESAALCPAHLQIDIPRSSLSLFSSLHTSLSTNGPTTLIQNTTHSNTSPTHRFYIISLPSSPTSTNNLEGKGKKKKEILKILKKPKKNQKKTTKENPSTSPIPTKQTSIPCAVFLRHSVRLSTTKTASLRFHHGPYTTLTTAWALPLELRVVVVAA